MNETLLFSVLDVVGIFVFAVSGAAAAIQRKLDIFGVVFLAFIAACGGGIIRDVLIGATPPATIVTWHYFALSAAAAIVTIWCRSLVAYIEQPVLFFDAIGLALFCVVGTQKVYAYTHCVEAAIFLGMVTAVGGGVIRDVVLNRIPLILRKEIYAMAALLGSAIVMLFEFMQWGKWGIWLAMSVCFGLRMLSLRYQWHLSFFANED